VHSWDERRISATHGEGGHATFLDIYPRPTHPPPCHGPRASSMRMPSPLSWRAATGGKRSSWTTGTGSSSARPSPKPAAGPGGKSSPWWPRLGSHGHPLPRRLPDTRTESRRRDAMVPERVHPAPQCQAPVLGSSLRRALQGHSRRGRGDQPAGERCLEGLRADRDRLCPSQPRSGRVGGWREKESS
jgi:hypothetical protein